MRLEPFAALDGVSVEATAEHLGTRLRFAFCVEGAVLDGPTPGRNSTWPRADGLWQTTCFEAFFAERGRSEYWELNLSPSTHRWNVYQFKTYRAPQPPTSATDMSLGNVQVSATELTAELARPKGWGELDLSLCAVIRTLGGVSYWASAHGGERPDFHRRAGFTLGLSPVVRP